MHEYHLIQPLIKTIEEKAKGIEHLKKITLIRIKLGVLKMVAPESFCEIFKELSKGSLCEGAKLSIEEVPGDVLYVENIEGEFDE